MDPYQSLSRRKEPRFKTCAGQSLQCDTVVNEEDLIQGTVIDISPSGLRLLCEGLFQPGQTFSTELKTDCSQGVYRGVIRRVEPWTAGTSVLGCQLLDTIPHDVLEALARQGIVNRRRDDRVDWHQPARMSWELEHGEVDIWIRDCSPGGLKIASHKPIPDNVRLRIFVDMGDNEQMVVDAKSVWQTEYQDGYLAGLVFTKREVPEVVARILATAEAGDEQAKQANQTSWVRRSVLVATGIVVFGLALWQTGVWE